LTAFVLVDTLNTRMGDAAEKVAFPTVFDLVTKSENHQVCTVPCGSPEYAMSISEQRSPPSPVVSFLFTRKVLQLLLDAIEQSGAITELVASNVKTKNKWYKCYEMLHNPSNGGWRGFTNLISPAATSHATTHVTQFRLKYYKKIGPRVISHHKKLKDDSAPIPDTNSHAFAQFVSYTKLVEKSALYNEMKANEQLAMDTFEQGMGAQPGGAILCRSALSFVSPPQDSDDQCNLVDADNNGQTLIDLAGAREDDRKPAAANGTRVIKKARFEMKPSFFDQGMSSHNNGIAVAGLVELVKSVIQKPDRPPRKNLLSGKTIEDYNVKLSFHSIKSKFSTTPGMEQRKRFMNKSRWIASPRSTR
jgi:hypothetical protein